MILENINPYNQSNFKSIFQSTEIYKKIKQDFDESNLIWNKFFWQHDLVYNKKQSNTHLTPRHTHLTCFSMSVFYYLMPLLETEYDVIYDLGCGKNMFKSYLPRLIGVGAETMLVVNNYNRLKDDSWPTISNLQDFENLPANIKEECINVHHVNFPKLFAENIFYGDIHGVVDDRYISEHQNYFQSVFSVCALHFYPLYMFKKIVVDFASMIKPGGRGFLSLNLQRMIDLTSENFLQTKFSTISPTSAQYDSFLRTELATIDLKFLILDVDLTFVDESMDGNIRLVIEK